FSSSQLLADPLAEPVPDPDTPLIFSLGPPPDPTNNPIILVADETVSRSADHPVGLALRPFVSVPTPPAPAAAGATAANATAANTVNTVLVIDPAPFRVAVVDYRDLAAAQSDSSDELAVWNADTGDGLSWRVVSDDATVRLQLPPQ